MLKKIKNSIAFRSGNVYKFILGFIPIFSMKRKPESDIKLITLTGKRQLGMLKESLFSLYVTCKILPKVTIFTDGSTDDKEILSLLKWYPNSIEVFPKDICINYHKLRDRDLLVQFALNNPMGLKMGVVLQSAENIATIYCDTDILFFKDIINISLIENLQNTPNYIAMSLDYQKAYDDNMVNKFFPELRSPPFYCAGFLMVKGNFLNWIDFNRILKEAIKESNHFTEQTIFAGINKNTVNNYVDNKLIACFQSDAQTLGPSFLNQNWVARHYVGPVRHIFWRDAFFIRLGFGKRKNG